MAGDRRVVAGQCSGRPNNTIFPCNIANKMQLVFVFDFFFQYSIFKCIQAKYGKGHSEYGLSTI